MQCTIWNFKSSYSLTCVCYFFRICMFQKTLEFQSMDHTNNNNMSLIKTFYFIIAIISESKINILNYNNKLLLLLF